MWVNLSRFRPAVPRAFALLVAFIGVGRGSVAVYSGCIIVAGTERNGLGAVGLEGFIPYHPMLGIYIYIDLERFLTYLVPFAYMVHKTLFICMKSPEIAA